MNMVQFDDAKQKKQLDDIHEQEERSLIEIVAARRGLPYIDLSVTPISNTGVSALSEDLARKGMLGIFNKRNNIIDVAAFSPDREDTQNILADLERKGYKINLHMTTRRDLERLWDRYKDISSSHNTEAGILDIGDASMEELAEHIKTVTDVDALVKKLSKDKGLHRVTKTFEIIIAGAFSLDASDIHLEAEEERARVRYRLDGVLYDVVYIEPKTYHLLLARIKLLSGLKLNVQEDTQDGRFSVRLKGLELQMRTSVLPGAFGENIVMRILNPESISVSLEDLGMEPKLLDVVNREIEKPNGMILTTGPTGSGKTTTLYAFLKRVYNSEVKIITIEDPVEYHLQGVSQTQVDTKSNYTFLSGLRAALRQDPDVIMVGEIRDSETAKIAVNASLTGHLVFSTLHTNNAAGTIPRLIDLGVNPKIISSALSLAIAQRLVRKLCSICKEATPPNEEDKKIIEKIIVIIQKKRPDQEIKIESLWKPKGCEKCGNTGYKGRIGVYEAILSDAAIEALITQNPSEREITHAAEPQGMLTMREDGILKVLQGVTTLEELEKSVDIRSDI